MAAAPKTRGGDLTARQINAANKKRDDEQKNRAEELSMASAAAKDALENEVVDLTDVKEPEAPAGDDAIVVNEVDVAEKIVTIRVNENIDMTYAGVSYKLEVGPKYKIPAHIAEWLEEKGIVWH